MHEHQCFQPTIYLLYCQKVFCNLKKGINCQIVCQSDDVMLLQDSSEFLWPEKNRLTMKFPLTICPLTRSSMPVAWDLSLSNERKVTPDGLQRKEGYIWWVGQPKGGPVGLNLWGGTASLGPLILSWRNLGSVHPQLLWALTLTEPVICRAWGRNSVPREKARNFGSNFARQSWVSHGVGTGWPSWDRASQRCPWSCTWV